MVKKSARRQNSKSSKKKSYKNDSKKFGTKRSKRSANYSKHNHHETQTRNMRSRTTLDRNPFITSDNSNMNGNLSNNLNMNHDSQFSFDGNQYVDFNTYNNVQTQQQAFINNCNLTPHQSSFPYVWEYQAYNNINPFNNNNINYDVNYLRRSTDNIDSNANYTYNQHTNQQNNSNNNNNNINRNKEHKKNYNNDDENRSKHDSSKKETLKKREFSRASHSTSRSDIRKQDRSSKKHSENATRKERKNEDLSSKDAEQLRKLENRHSRKQSTSKSKNSSNKSKYNEGNSLLKKRTNDLKVRVERTINRSDLDGEKSKLETYKSTVCNTRASTENNSFLQTTETKNVLCENNSNKLDHKQNIDQYNFNLNVNTNTNGRIHLDNFKTGIILDSNVDKIYNESITNVVQEFENIKTENKSLENEFTNQETNKANQVELIKHELENYDELIRNNNYIQEDAKYSVVSVKRNNSNTTDTINSKISIIPTHRLLADEFRELEENVNVEPYGFNESHATAITDKRQSLRLNRLQERNRNNSFCSNVTVSTDSCDNIITKLANMDKSSIKNIINTPDTKYDNALTALARKRVREELRRQLKAINFDSKKEALGNNIASDEIVNSIHISDLVVDEIRKVLGMNLLNDNLNKALTNADDTYHENVKDNEHFSLMPEEFENMHPKISAGSVYVNQTLTNSLPDENNLPTSTTHNNISESVFENNDNKVAVVPKSLELCRKIPPKSFKQNSTLPSLKIGLEKDETTNYQEENTTKKKFKKFKNQEKSVNNCEEVIVIDSSPSSSSSSVSSSSNSSSSTSSSSSSSSSANSSSDTDSSNTTFSSKLAASLRRKRFKLKLNAHNVIDKFEKLLLPSLNDNLIKRYRTKHSESIHSKLHFIYNVCTSDCNSRKFSKADILTIQKNLNSPDYRMALNFLMKEIINIVREKKQQLSKIETLKKVDIKQCQLSKKSHIEIHNKRKEHSPDLNNQITSTIEFLLPQITAEETTISKNDLIVGDGTCVEEYVIKLLSLCKKHVITTLVSTKSLLSPDNHHYTNSAVENDKHCVNVDNNEITPTKNALTFPTLNYNSLAYSEMNSSSDALNQQSLLTNKDLDILLKQKRPISEIVFNSLRDIDTRLMELHKKNASIDETILKLQKEKMDINLLTIKLQNEKFIIINSVMTSNTVSNETTSPSNLQSKQNLTNLNAIKMEKIDNKTMEVSNNQVSEVNTTTEPANPNATRLENAQVDTEAKIKESQNKVAMPTSTNVTSSPASTTMTTMTKKRRNSSPVSSEYRLKRFNNRKNSNNIIQELIVETVSQKSPRKASQLSSSLNVIPSGNIECIKSVITQIRVFEKYIVASTEEGTLCLFNATSLKLIKQFAKHTEAITQMYLCLDKALIYTTSLDGYLKKTSLENIELDITSLYLQEPLQSIDIQWGIAFLGTRWGNIYTYDISENRISENLFASTSSIIALKATKNGTQKLLIVSSKGNLVQLRDAITGLLLRTLDLPDTCNIYSILLDDNIIYCGTQAKEIHKFDLMSGSHLGVLTSGNGAVVMQMYNNRYIFVGCYDGFIYILDKMTGVIKDRLTGSGKMVIAVEIINNKIITSAKDRTMKVMDIPDHCLINNLARNLTV